MGGRRGGEAGRLLPHQFLDPLVFPKVFVQPPLTGQVAGPATETVPCVQHMARLVQAKSQVDVQQFFGWTGFVGSLVEQDIGA